MIERGFPIKRFCNCGPGLRHSLIDGWSLCSFAQASYTMRNFVVSADFLTTAFVREVLLDNFLFELFTDYFIVLFIVSISLQFYN